MSYPGGKAGAGVYQTIINQMPPHDVYVEPFVGAGAVMKLKRPALRNIAIDLSDDAAARWRDYPGVEFHYRCGIGFLESFRPQGSELIYCDPPYLIGARRSGRRIYRHEMTDADHLRLLDALNRLRCNIIISGYRSDLYAHWLRGWRAITFQAMTRGGLAEEWLWCNFDQPTALHDYRYLGDDYRDRERIKRKCARWRAKFAGLDDLERLALLSALMQADPRLSYRCEILSPTVPTMPAGIAASTDAAGCIVEDVEAGL